VSEVPEEYQSTTPARLRDLAQQHAHTLPTDVLLAMASAAAEIEGSEEAYAALVSQVGDLRKRLANTTANHQHTLEFICRWRELLVALQAERADDIRLRRALAGEHPMRPAPWEPR
jgi:hypothetical protein